MDSCLRHYGRLEHRAQWKYGHPSPWDAPETREINQWRIPGRVVLGNQTQRGLDIHAIIRANRGAPTAVSAAVAAAGAGTQRRPGFGGHSLFLGPCEKLELIMFLTAPHRFRSGNMWIWCSEQGGGAFWTSEKSGLDSVWKVGFAASSIFLARA